jgi:hypothetical protein
VPTHEPEYCEKKKQSPTPHATNNHTLFLLSEIT